MPFETGSLQAHIDDGAKCARFLSIYSGSPGLSLISTGELTDCHSGICVEEGLLLLHDDSGMKHHVGGGSDGDILHHRQFNAGMFGQTQAATHAEL